MDAYEQVWSENMEAWGLYRRMCSRFAYDFHAVPVLLEKAVADCDDADDAIELTERLAMIYDVVSPPLKKKD